MPMTKVGSDTPISDTVRITRLSQCDRLMPVKTPRPMPMVRARTADAATSSRVAGIRSTISVPTRRCSLSDMPKSPCTALST